MYPPTAAPFWIWIQVSALVETVVDPCEASTLDIFDRFRVSACTALGASQPCWQKRPEKLN